MGKEKRPSIYVDRGTLGSSDELDEYGVWVKSEPHDLASTGIDSAEIFETSDMDFEVPEMDDLPGFDVPGAESRQDTAADDDFDLPLMEFDSNEDSEGESDSDVFNFGDLAGVDNVEEAVDETVEETVSQADDEHDDEYVELSMDDFIGAMDPGDDDSSEFSVDIAGEEDTFQDDDDSPPPDPEVANIAQKGSRSPVDLSTQLLMKIAEELSSIRSELSSLKKEFSGIKVASKSSETEEGRIFGEDDEKIALTGDELNNILNTADFTEETGADVTIELSENLSISSTESLETDLSLEDMDFPEEAADLESIDLESVDLESVDLESDELGSIELNADDFEPDMSLETLEDLDIAEDETPDLALEGAGGLSEIREKGAEPMTFPPAPEDSDYLAEDPMGNDQLEESFELEEISLDPASDFSDAIDLPEDPIDLSEAVIDEPDLYSEIQENPLEEPALEDISIDLDLSELDPTDLDSPELDTLDLEPVEPDFSSLETEDTEADDLEPINLEPMDFESDSQTGSDMSLIPEGFGTDTEPEELDSAELEQVDLESMDMPEEVFLDEASDEELEPIDIGELEEIEEPDTAVAAAAPASVPTPTVPAPTPKTGEGIGIPTHLKQELKTVLAYMDQLLEALPDDKIEEFARSEYYDTYKKLFKELGLV